MSLPRVRQFLLLVSMLWLQVAQAAPESRSIQLADGTEVSYQHYPAKGKRLMLWLYSEAGPQSSEDTVAQQLAQKGIEVWRLDLFDAHFLPIATSSMDMIPDSDFAELIRLAHEKTGKQVYPVTTGRGMVPVLRGARQYQLAHPQGKALQGVILLSPKFFVETPDPGEESKLMPIVDITNLPLYVIQPEKSPWFWKLDQTIPALEKNGSDVFVQRLKDVRDRFYFRADATRQENQLARQLPGILLRGAAMLDTVAAKQRVAISHAEQKPEIRVGKKDRELKVYKGNPQPPALRLLDMRGQWLDLADLKGKVVLVNFWASWCPPCVHEMPSMQQLQNRFAQQPFTILGVNMAEDKATIQSFLDNKVRVDFPIVLDSDGAALKRWGVFAFPTSYVLDKQGNIRYALFGGVDWTTQDIIEKIQALMKE